MTLEKVTNLINGKFKPALDGDEIQIIDPSTDLLIGHLTASKSKDVNEAVEAAAVAFETWSTRDPLERAKFMNKIADLIMENLDELAMLESRDQGKPFMNAKMIDVPGSAQHFRYFANVITTPKMDRSHNQETHFGLVQSTATRQPVGVAGLISPWNFPLYLLTWKIAPAMAFGNTFVAKPSEVTSLTAFRLAQLMTEAGLPRGVANFVFGSGPEAGEPLVMHQKVDLVSFTGSTKIGAHIRRVTADQIKKVSLELGGKNPAIVFGDADIDKAVVGCARSAFTNQGEVCLCTERTYVHESIYDEFLAKIKLETAKWTIGDPRDPKTKIGPLVSQEHYEKVKGCFEKAKSKGYIEMGYSGNKLPADLGASYQLASANQKGYFVPPTILTNVPDDNCLFTDEIFGPVTAVTKFASDEEVIKRANNTKYGLCATIWTKDLAKANRIARKIQAGTIWINCWCMRDLNMPFGGMKQSGLGRESGFDSEDFFTEAQCISTLY